MSYKVAIIGATGAVGNKLLSTLIERNFPLKELYLLASNRSKGKELKFKNRKFIVQSIERFDFEDVDIAFFSAGSYVSAKYAEESKKNT